MIQDFRLLGAKQNCSQQTWSPTILAEYIRKSTMLIWQRGKKILENVPYAYRADSHHAKDTRPDSILLFQCRISEKCLVMSIGQF
jgi:hypothetical protein